MLVVTVSKDESVRVGGATIRVVKDGNRLRWYIQQHVAETIEVGNGVQWRRISAKGPVHEHRT